MHEFEQTQVVCCIGFGWFDSKHIMNTDLHNLLF